MYFSIYGTKKSSFNDFQKGVFAGNEYVILHVDNTSVYQISV